MLNRQTVMQCTHCFGEVPYGASVCRGCGAEIEYGTPKAVRMMTVLVAVLVGASAAGKLPSDMSVLGWVLGGIVGGGGWVMADKLFSHRIVFKRVYHTRK